jgi:hypothetical protein
LLLTTLSDHFFKFYFVTGAIEKPRQWTLKRARKNQEFFIKENPKLLYSVVINKVPKKAAESKLDREIDLGLPPQPKEYLKYPDCDWL